jgi:copper transport protein
MHSIRRRLSVVAVAALAVLVVALVGAPTASAHATLLFSTPAAGSSLTTAPRTVTLTFDEPVTLPSHAVRVAAAGGASISLGAVSRSRGGDVVSAALGSLLPSGIYTVTWQVIAQDGDAVTGSFRFGVGVVPTGLLTAGGTVTRTAGQASTTVLRWVMFAALAWLLGDLAAHSMLRRRRPDAGWRMPRRWMRIAAAAGAVACVGLAGLIAGGGSLREAFTHPASSELGSLPGTVALVEAGAFVLAALLSPWRTRWAWLAPAVIVGAEGLRAHPGDYQPGWGVLLTIAHLAAAGLWAGALIHVACHAVRWRAIRSAVWMLIRDYARLAGWLFLAVLATGTLSTLVVLPLSRLVGTGYGQILLVKTGLVLAAATCALAARRRLRRRGRGLPLRLVGVEAGLLATVLVVTAVLTTVAPPRQRTAALALPPPASGPVVAVGSRAGEVGISAQASMGQLVVQLFAPGSESGPDISGGGETPARYRLAASFTTSTGAAERLTPRGCGPGCYAARVAWRTGTNQLSLRVSAAPWRAGQVALTITWPPHPDPALLRRLAATLRHTANLVYYERVTSDTTTGPGTPQRITITGPAFLTTEPYSTGQATVVDSVRNPDRTSTLLLAYPSQGIYVDLTLDPTGRLTRETLTGPDHLITRTFIEPE